MIQIIKIDFIIERANEFEQIILIRTKNILLLKSVFKSNFQSSINEHWKGNAFSFKKIPCLKPGNETCKCVVRKFISGPGS